jgi:hypothetical protein
MKGWTMQAWIAAVALLVPADAWAQGCPPPGWDRARLETLREAGFVIDDPAARARFAEDLIACLDARDPSLRDAIGFEALSRMLRAGQIDDPAKTRMARALLDRLERDDPEGFGRPFAALVLAEIVRADRIVRYLPDDLRAAIVDAAANYLAGVRDYRGFDERDGWRHGVAHGADLLMQIAANPHVGDRAQLARLREAIAAQVAPAAHSYIYGEPERLMLPVILLARRGVFDEADWTAWFAALAAPAPLSSWREAFQSQVGLARRHNLRAFLYAVWLNARIGDNADDDVLLPGAEAALRAMS